MPPIAPADESGLEAAVDAGVGQTGLGLAVGGKRGIWIAPSSVGDGVAAGSSVGGKEVGTSVVAGNPSVGCGAAVAVLVGETDAGADVSTGCVTAGVEVLVGDGAAARVGASVGVLTGDD
jgi:hypothetical protein